MRKLSMVLLATLVAITVAAQLNNQQLAGTYFNAFFTGDYEQAFEMQSEAVKAQFGLAQMQGAADYYAQNYGNIINVISLEESEKGGYYIATYYTRFEKGYMNINVVLDGDGKVAQFLAQPAAAPDSVASYVDTSNFQEVDVTIGEDPWTLPGKLTVPTGKASFPIMIILGGSGPTDMDCSIGPNKTYRDIAWGLATEGVATLRYSKRPAVY